MSGSTRPPSADPSDLHAIVLAPADLGELELAGLASAAVQHGDTDSTDTWSTRSGSVSSASGQELAEAIQSCSILPSIGDIAVESSSEVYIGSNTHFHGAVTLLVPPSSLPGLLPPAVQGRRSALTEREKQADDHQPPPSTPTAESREQPAREKRWIERLQTRYAVTILGSMVVLAVMVMIAVLVSRDEG
ncbi:uncharacterized protein LOC113212165 [Frankliniella occidentalis]|uniref:Uncharacterized protein LOC113212165 n=1 Tax=Frankliniella occidentalis TaxID=133901 RepID=A0A9C6XWC7_FRAOC|nr:uncharacterized protein LOC113212165 [Frankliniella occidentalis]